MRILKLLFVLFIAGASLTQVNAQENSSLVEWMSFEEAVERSKTDKKKIFIDVYTDWCGWCKVMDKNTFNDPDIAKYMNQNFHNVKFDAEQKDPVTFRDYTFEFVASGNRGYHQLAASLLNNKLSFPTVVFLDEEFNMISPVPGYQKPAMFEKVIKYFGGEHYKDISWKEWEKSF